MKEMSWKRPTELISNVFGTIHEQRRQFFRIFDTPLPHVGGFLVMSDGNFDQFLTPPPLLIADIDY